MADFKEICGRRAACLGVVTRHVNTLRAILSRSPVDSMDEAGGVSGKLLQAKERFDAVNDEVLLHPDCGLQLSEENKSSAGKATQAVVSVLDDYENWKLNGPVSGAVQNPEGGACADTGSGIQVQEATLSVLMQLQQSMARMSQEAVSNAVKLALSEQSMIHEREKLALEEKISSLSRRLDGVKFEDHYRSGRQESMDYDERLTSTTYHSRESAGPIRNRLSGFGRGRVRSGVYVREVGGGAMSESLGQDNSMLMQSLLEQSMLQHQSLVANMQAPKVSLKKFNGDPLEYASFTSAFDDLIHNVMESDRSRLLQLLEHCTGDAERAVKGCVHMSASEGYQEARRILKERFGEAYVVTQAWLDKIMGYPALDSGKLLSEFASDLLCCRNGLESMGSLAEIECTSNLRVIVAKLPVHLRAKWRRTARKNRDQHTRRIDQLVQLIKDAAEDDCDPTFSEEAISRVKATYGVKSPNPRSAKLGQAEKAHVNYTRDDYFSGVSEECRDVEGEIYAVARSACAACRSGQHFTSRCRNFKELGPKERLEFVKSKNLCVLCLSDMHSTDKCPLPWRCQDKSCGQRHHTALHGAFQKAVVNVAELVESVGEVQASPVSAQTYCCVSTASLPVIRVKVQWGEKTLFANALLDTGSTCSMIHEDLVVELGAPMTSTGADFSIRTVTSIEVFEGKIAGVRISHPADNFKHHLSNAMVVPRVPVSSDCIPLQESIEKWDHLKALNIPYPRVEDGVQILIGQNNSHLLDFGEPIKAPGTQTWAPYAVESPLGYCIQGSLEEDADWTSGDIPLSYAIGGSVLIQKIGEIMEEEPIVEEKQGTGDVDTLSAQDLESSVEWDSLREELRELTEQVRSLASLDEVPDCELMPRDDRYVLDLWERSWRFEEGHIVLPIPFKADPPELMNNFNAAYRSLMQLGRTLLPHPEELLQYKTAIFKYFEQGHAEVVHDENPGDPGKLVWYLLHMGVKHPRKPNVTRVVKRGDAQYKGCSLNKAAYKGPDLMNSLVGVLTRFRQFRVGTTGDLEGMFNQVLVPEDQRDLERFLFWEDGDPTKRVIVCRMKTHVFGSVWAPAAANFAVKKLAELEEKIDPEIAESMRKEFYVDDWMNSERSDDKSEAMLVGVRAAVAKGNFNMVKIASSSREVLARVEVASRAKELAKVDLTNDKLPRSYMLGQGWEPDPDSLVFSMLLEPKPFTRRGMTSCVSSVFDPLGLLCPFMLPAKILMQNACKEVSGWDSQLQSVTAEQWSEWLVELEQVDRFKMKRWFGCDDTTRNIFHIFADASEKAYAAVSYLAVLRAEKEASLEEDGAGDAVGNQCSVKDVEPVEATCENVSTLVNAKSRVAPSKRLTIPQLEMAGAVLAVKIAQMAMKVFSIRVESVFYWVDSTIVLVLIHKDPGELKTYMGNRVTFIQQLTEVTQWGHVPSDLNPADIASRGMRMSELVDNKLWSSGPDFVRQSQESWPAKTVKIKSTGVENTHFKKTLGQVFAVEVCAVSCSVQLSVDMGLVQGELLSSDRQAEVCAVSAEPNQERQIFDRIVGRYSDWKKTIRFAVIMSMLARYWRAKRKSDFKIITQMTEKQLCGAEVLSAEERNLVIWSQKFDISWEDRLSPSWKKLSPFKSDGWRVGGRFLYAEMPEDEKHPLILPKKGLITEQVVAWAHTGAGHGGADRTLMELRSKYWVLGGRATVKKSTDVCILCRRLKARPCEQQMAPLPAERLVKGRPVFWYSGVDLFGPVTVVIKRSSVKRYGALFTCMNTRAVHLEPVEDLTTSAFLDTLERFCDRRGKPDTLQSDNGTNFVGADGESRRAEKLLLSEGVAKELGNRRIKWKFNAPSGSHQGGVWERLIRSVRQLLLVLTKGHSISDSRFHTVLCMAEAIMNSRPLTRLTEDVTSLDALTPFHFISLQAVRPLFPGKYDVDQLRRDWRLSQGLAGEFWEQWMRLYLPQLQKRTKWLEERRNIRVNELVLVVNDQYARCEWPLGVITQVHPGKDGLVRNVTVRTGSGYWKRPVQKIVRLEMDVT